MERDKHELNEVFEYYANKEIVRQVKVLEKMNYETMLMLKRIVTILEKLDAAQEKQK
jgi:hypothetical protein